MIHSPTPVDEILDLVDSNDIVVGQKTRSEVYEQELSNFRVINVFVVNDRGELWIPRRTAQKRIFPLHLDVSVGGHVESGENYEDAFHREVLEEINIDTRITPYKLLGKLTPTDGISAFMQVYEIKKNSAPRYNQEDFIEYFWLKPQALMQKIAKGEKVKSDLPKLIQMFYPPQHELA
ncbi:MAG: NUDIX domain-containing protein [Patescibacteria group bacterium]